MDDDMLYHIYEPTNAPDTTVKLPAYHWQFYSRIDGLLTAIEIAQNISFPEEAARNAVKGLISAKAIKQRLWTFNEFFPAIPKVDTNGILTANYQSNEPASDTERLSDVIDFISARSNGDMEGKLTVYRVFLKIPPELLEEEGITSLDFSDVSHEIRNDALKQAISQATADIIGVPYSWQGSN